jgi:hypothetical protein
MAMITMKRPRNGLKMLIFSTRSYGSSQFAKGMVKQRFLNCCGI